MADTRPPKRKRETEGADDDHTAKRHSPHPTTAAAASAAASAEPCPYLDTINRGVLEMDVEKVCSVSMNALNVYVCLVCGKFLSGRGPSTPAYFHSLDEDHHVFMSLETQKSYCLPDGTEVVDASLSDIKAVVNPRFTAELIAQLDTTAAPMGHDLSGNAYRPGLIGLNNLSHTDGINAVLSALAVASPLRDFFLRSESLTGCKDALVLRFGEFMRKVWHAANFKAHVAPQELLQAVVVASKKSFRPAERSDPMAFLIFLLNGLSRGLKSIRRSDAVDGLFRGSLRVIQERVFPAVAGEAAPVELISDAAHPFFCLSLEPPPPPLFQDNRKASLIHQVSLLACLAKYDGHTPTAMAGDQRRRHILSAGALPPLLVLHLKRFEKNQFVTEKSPTIVHAPIRGLDMSPFVDGPIDPAMARYDLLASICHDGPADGGAFYTHVRSKATGQWFTIADLEVRETQAETVATAEGYVLLYERAASSAAAPSAAQR